MLVEFKNGFHDLRDVRSVVIVTDKHDEVWFLDKDKKRVLCDLTDEIDHLRELDEDPEEYALRVKSYIFYGFYHKHRCINLGLSIKAKSLPHSPHVLFLERNEGTV